MAEALHTLAMIQQAESPEVGDKALGSQNMALEVRNMVSTSLIVYQPDTCMTFLKSGRMVEYLPRKDYA